jgi:hypothetical protein
LKAIVIDFSSADVARTVIAIAVVLSFPFVLFYGDQSGTFAQTYSDVVTAVVSFYFAVRGSEGGAATAAATGA